MATTVGFGDHGPAVKELQAAVDETLKGREFPWRMIRADGRFGEKTQAACHFTGWLLGFSPSQLSKIKDGTVTSHADAIFVKEKKRSDAMKKRERERRPVAKKLRFLHDHPQRRTRAKGVTTFDGVPVATWMVRWLRKSRENGWRGELTSGYRTPQHSEDVCRGICGQPTCPGRCAGRSSNHSGKDFPAGAVDVTDEFTFAAIQRRIGSPLKNAIPTDRIHFSESGH